MVTACTRCSTSGVAQVEASPGVAVASCDGELLCVQCCGIWYPGSGGGMLVRLDESGPDPLLELWGCVGSYSQEFIRAVNEHRAKTGEWPSWLQPRGEIPAWFSYLGHGSWGDYVAHVNGDDLV